MRCQLLHLNSPSSLAMKSFVAATEKSFYYLRFKEGSLNPYKDPTIDKVRISDMAIELTKELELADKQKAEKVLFIKRKPILITYNYKKGVRSTYACIMNEFF